MKKVSKDYRASDIEESVKNRWKETGAYAKAKDSGASGPVFSFNDGPPYTTGSVHVGTAWNKVLKDLFLRYKRMQGFNVWDQPGYDMHGLPIEVRVEQTIGTKNKKDIEAYGVEKFIESCKKFAIEFMNKMTDEFKQLGVWLDWDNPYQTIERPFISSVWWTFSEAFKKDLVSKAHRVLPWCPRCETALAEAEIEYWDETDPSIYIRFSLVDNPDESLIIWTTTPWTIPGNIAAAVHPDDAYAKVEVKTGKGPGEIFIVMKSLVDSALPAMGFPNFTVVGEITGKELLGKKYSHPLLDFVPAQKTFSGEYIHAVVVSDTVARENTGIVHIAPGHGPEDFEIGKQFGLPAFCPVDEEGMFTSEAGERYAGKPVNEGGKQILDDLQDIGLLVKEDSITHRYGHCWRCKTPIIYRTTDQWFLKIPTIKNDILRSNESVKWFPEWAGTSRERDWIVNARDWCISRQRYWGTPIPIWECQCGEIRVVSGYEELRSAEGFIDGMDPHRPWIDKLTFKCPKCQGTMNRIPDVLDVWIDSGACSWSSLGYPEKNSLFEKWWPLDWITEAHDQTRGWFYSQLVLGTIIFDKSPFKSVLMHGWALDSSGRPMSKSEGTAIDPKETIKAFGADSLRWYLFGAVPPWDDLAFQKDGPKEANRFLNIFWNVFKFASLYMSIDNYDPIKDPLKKYLDILKPEDRWILSRLENTKSKVTASLDEYLPHEADRTLEKFITDDLSRWYVRLIRDRMWIEGGSAEKVSAFAVLHRILHDTVLMMAPFAPFITEEMYQNINGAAQTVHMEHWPSVDDSLKDEGIESGMDLAREMVEKIANARQSSQLNLRWPLKRIVVKADADDIFERIKALKEVLISQVNAKELQTVPVGEEWDELELAVVPNPNAIGKVYRQWSSKIAVLLKTRPAKTIKEGVDKGEYSIGIEGQLITITPNMVSFSSSLPPDIVQVEFSHGIIYIDFEMTEDLLAEGYSREMVRRVQQMRKDMKLDVEEFIDMEVRCSDKLTGYLQQWNAHISKETRARKMSFLANPKGDYIVEWNIEEESIAIGIANLKMKEKVGELAQIPGLSLDRAMKLHSAGFKDVSSISRTSDNQIISASGVDQNDLQKIRDFALKKGYATVETQPFRPELTPAPIVSVPPEQKTEVQKPSAPQPVPAQVEPIQAPPVIVLETMTQEIPKEIPTGEKPEEKATIIPPVEMVLEKSSTYLIEEDRPATSYNLLLKQLGAGMKGLCVTRNYPAKIRTRFQIGETPIFWLSNVGKDSAIRPKDLEKLSITITQFLDSGNAIVLLDGLEYLITNNNFITVLRLIQSMRDQVTLHQSILVVAINPSTLESHQLNLLEREFDGVIRAA
ncbi:MAG: isoleucine--tRNA ligase [Thermoplasmata archaeon]|nr:isoleucine--tRNA ligase [Thermoplasmata archaeon]